jgi:hypothetical protein
VDPAAWLGLPWVLLDLRDLHKITFGDPGKTLGDLVARVLALGYLMSRT